MTEHDTRKKSYPYATALHFGNADLEVLMTRLVRRGVSVLDFVAAIVVSVVLLLLAAPAWAQNSYRHHHTPSPSPSPSPSPTGFYVATTGNDSNNGLSPTDQGGGVGPFGTLGKCQDSMRASGTVKTCYIRAGTYTPAIVGTGGACLGTAVLVLNSSSDSNTTWSHYPPDGVGTAIIDAQSSSSTTGAYSGICVSGGTTGVVINGLHIQNAQYDLIEDYDSNLLIENNILHDNHATANNGLIDIGGNAAKNVTVDHNYLYNSQQRGVSAGTCLYAGCGGGIDGLVISNNYVYNTCTVIGDCGAIYVIDYQTPRSNITIRNNYVRDVYVSGGGRGIYLDDGTSNATVTGNIVIGAADTCFNIHGGSNDVYQYNICDEDSQPTAILLYQNADCCNNGSGNIFENNIIISGYSFSGYGYDGDISLGGPPTINNNFYHNYVGSWVRSSGPAFRDSNPVTGDPQLSCWAYNIAGSSPVFNSPVSFQDFTHAWGPPGFAIPEVGTAPSQSHSC